MPTIREVERRLKVDAEDDPLCYVEGEPLMAFNCVKCGQQILPSKFGHDLVEMNKCAEALTLGVEKIHPTRRDSSDLLCYWHQKQAEMSRGARMSEHEKHRNMIVYGREVV